MIIFTKFHEDWAKIVDFLLIANYLASPLFYYSHFIFIFEFFKECAYKEKKKEAERKEKEREEKRAIAKTFTGLIDRASRNSLQSCSALTQEEESEINNIMIQNLSVF